MLLAATAQHPAAGPVALVRERVHALPTETALVVVVGLLWVTQLTWRTGGREPRALTWTVSAVAACLLVQRPWRRLPRVELGLAGAVAAAPWLVVLGSPTGWAGRADAASYSTAAGVYLAVRCWAGTRARGWAVLTSVALAGILEFQQGWLAWWGGEQAARPFEGTFYWHNQTGVFLAVCALVGLGLVALGGGRLVALGALTVVLCVPGVLFTTSRASQLGLSLGAGILLLGLVAGRRWAASARVAGAALGGWLASVALSGPPFFPHRASPLDGTRARGHVEALTGNTVQRLDDWHRAWAIFRHWPLTGAGFHSFLAATTAVHVRTDGNATAFAHNSYLQALADGGLVLFVPLSAGLGLLLVATARAALSRRLAQPAVAAATGVALTVALLHAGMDFDWSYPGLLALAAVLLAVLRGSTAAPSGTQPGWRRADLAGTLLVAALAVVVAVAGWSGGLSLNAPLGGAG